MSRIAAAVLAILLLAPGSISGQRQTRATFRVEETTIVALHASMKSGALTCSALVSEYLRRIEAYDKNGPALNAIVQVNPDAMKQAADLDRRFKTSGLSGPLHCIPVIVKDNFETIGLQSAAGSLALKGFVSHRDAFQVRRVEQSGVDPDPLMGRIGQRGPVRQDAAGPASMVGQIGLLEVGPYIGVEVAVDGQFLGREIGPAKSGLGAQAAIALGNLGRLARQRDGRPPAMAGRDRPSHRHRHAARFRSTKCRIPPAR